MNITTINIEFVTLESRTDPAKEKCAALIPEGSKVPKEFAVIHPVSLPPHICKMLEPLFQGPMDAPTHFTRQQLLALFALFGTVVHDAGIQLGKESKEMEE